jgi:hypothetical protein
VHQDVDIIGHHRPGKHVVAVIVEMEHRLLSKPGDEGISQLTRPVAAVEVFLQPGALLTNVFDLQQMLPLRPA